MKMLRLAVFILALAQCAFAAEKFPGLKSVLTPEEWQRARLDRLTPDELGVIDAALIRHFLSGQAATEAKIGAMRQTVNEMTEERKRGLLQRFGLPVFGDSDWRNLPPLNAKVVSWAGGNRFKLDNDQVWEGVDSIPYELVGKQIEIQARPMGQYALIVEGANTTLRVFRLR
ncbi:MAG TPA: hypothetical protein VMM36_11370 [Opitutaceae bacterium]|nr:hypothetical protein [Opitutaceae bacterium]